MLVKASLQYEIEGRTAIAWEIVPEAGSVTLEVGLTGVPASLRIVVATAKGEDPRQAIDACLRHFRTWLRQTEDMVSRSAESAYPIAAQGHEA